MTKTQALKVWAEVYTKVQMASSVKPYCLKTAVEYGVMDMVNQTKGMDDAAAAFMINDDAEWMMEKLA